MFLIHRSLKELTKPRTPKLKTKTSIPAQERKKKKREKERRRERGVAKVLLNNLLNPLVLIGHLAPWVTWDIWQGNQNLDLDIDRSGYYPRYLLSQT